jgi:hypothetical protein
MPEVPPDVLKEAVKEGLKEWLTAQCAAFGKLSAQTLFGLVLCGLVYLAVRYGSRLAP